MNSVSSNTNPSFTCSICLGSNEVTTGQSAWHTTLVRTSCQPKPHIFHLGCITEWLDGDQQKRKSLDQRQCCDCKQPALPLVRVNGSRILEKDSFYCESLVLHVCRTGDLTTLNKLLALDASLATQMYLSAVTDWAVYPLAIAIDSGHIDCAQALIDHQADVNAADQEGRTPLHIAAENGNVQCLKWLVTHGASVNATNKKGETPLHIATQIGVVEARQQWAAMGRNIDESYDDGRIFQQYTSKKENDTGCLKELLANSEVDINAIDNGGVTPLMIAALWGKSERLKWLLDAGADINTTDHLHWKALYFATISDCAESVKVLLAVPGIRCSRRDIYGWTALHLAARNNCVESLKVLLATHGSRLNKPSYKGLYALHIAAKYDSAESIKELLLAPGTSINKKSYKGLAALHIAAKHDNTESVETLLANPGIRVNMKTNKGWTALQIAAEHGSTGSVKALLASPGIQVNKKVNGRTALHLAATYGHFGCVEAMLFAPGIQIDEHTDDGMSALSLATIHGHSRCMDLLLVYGVWHPEHQPTN
ncbi:ankyrin repeat domain-containing protein [Thalassotalea sp. G20_0]|uniref:ankyrin repeat domain-containing protein n=1 Tax=Thalassotalea sp. G20_0 TaxID=2821093 RepID=UPI001ADC3469|nr:ankyrin repeat domain-containing protein [Thalassotalea sp. G20_0]MBO9496644.1 ankyrin repeat domain-containing protein [Thalassotalea sp. G20_0]